MRRASFWVGNSNTAEIVYAYVDYEPKDNEYLKDVKGRANYTEIKEWINNTLKYINGSSLYSLYKAHNLAVHPRPVCCPKISRHFLAVLTDSQIFSRHVIDKMELKIIQK